ncbi:NAD kinase [Lactobacillus corticis]|uniref:NAD kinase n=1 Tax=Lactobacillus corticis TaxID=2201249 RepID=A0A916QHQ2_9LACO|nr:NAD kinase [Lactobacillus corticis]GFZ26212.1 ATP-NAD kinase [Lactobacillus corticis]
MKVGIVHNDQPKTLQVVAHLMQLLKRYELPIDNKYPDVVITVGGDGTFISAVHKYIDQIDSIRFIGVHTGHLGFYTDWRNFDIDKMVQVLARKEADTISYPLLEVSLFSDQGQKTQLAVNESTLRRIAQTLEADVFVDRTLFENFRGDGLCVATPMGSTAYSKSLGGAIIQPNLRALQMTEIASLNNQVFRTLHSPMVIGPEEWITVKFESTDDIVITVDGKQLDASGINKIVYRISDHKIHFDRFGHHHFWTRVQDAFIGMPHANI